MVFKSGPILTLKESGKDILEKVLEHDDTFKFRNEVIKLVSKYLWFGTKTSLN